MSETEARTQIDGDFGKPKDYVHNSFDSGLSVDLEDIEENAEETALDEGYLKNNGTPDGSTTSSGIEFLSVDLGENGIEEIIEKPCLMADKFDASFLAPDLNALDSHLNNNETEEMDQAADKLVAQMLDELRQPVHLRMKQKPDEPTVTQKATPIGETHSDFENRVAMAENKLHHVDAQEDCYLAPELDEIEQLATKEWKMEIVWANVAIQVALHLGTFYGLYLAFTAAYWQTNVWMVLMILYAGNSITAGAHRMWCHKAYKANFGVRLFYMIGTTMSAQNDVIEWARDHRVHHKWADSDADPHNINRGFFFAHMGWLMVRKHPKVKEMGAKIDMSDLEADPLLAFQRRYYAPLVISSLLFLTAVPVYGWGETWTTAYFVGAILRLTLQLHGTWFINSAAHTFGWRPFDTKVTAVDTYFYACITNGEAWHNYHHTFPQDYRASEYLWKGNMSAVMIDFFAYMGWVWDRKTMSKEAIERQKKKGDHSRPMTAAHDD